MGRENRISHQSPQERKEWGGQDIKVEKSIRCMLINNIISIFLKRHPDVFTTLAVQ